MLHVVNVLGRLLVVFSVTYLVPITCSLIFHDGMLWHFVDGMAISAAGGALLYLATRRHYRELKPRDGFLLVTLSWVLMAAIASVPLMLAYDNMSFTDAYFEMISGLTTTGATVMIGLDLAPQSINIWRHLMNWIGGMGIIVFAVAILPLLGVGGMQLYKAETPGPMKDSKLTARIADTAKALYLVYVGMTIVCLVALRLAGMSWFDATCHAFSAMGLGGFSTRDASVGAFDSVTVEAVLSFFMLLAGINFATHFLAVRRLSWGPYLRDTEARAYLLIMGLAFVGLTSYLIFQGVYEDAGRSARMVMFNLVSIGTGSGYASTDYAQWPIFAPLLMLFLGGIIPCAGSTGGGIKMVRTLVLFGQSQREILKLIHPAAVRPLMIGRNAVSERVAQSVLGFIFLYFMSAALMIFVLLLSGLDFLTAFSAIIACINNIGPGLGDVGPSGNYQALNDFQTWVCAFAMLLGRLEIFAVLVIFTPGFWRKQSRLADRRFHRLSLRPAKTARTNPPGLTMAAPRNDSFLRALLRQPTDHTPIWLMRQAGRYLPEYCATRRRAGSFLQLCKSPAMACEVTLQPLERFPLDAAILFSDILTVPDAMGLGLYFAEGEGPKFERPVRSEAAIHALRAPDPHDELRYVVDAVSEIRRALDNSVPLIGFSGSPWTLASYMVEGGASDDYRHLKTLMLDRPDLLHHLLGVTAQAVTDYLNAQIEAGAQAVMIFDSWGGALSAHGYLEFSLAYMQRIVAGLKREHDGERVPVIMFTKGGGQWLEAQADAGADALGLDWTTDIGLARQRVGHKVALQGNFDPTALFAQPASIAREAERILDSYGPHPGHVFNLGHGISQHTPPEHVSALVEAVHRHSRSIRAAAGV